MKQKYAIVSADDVSNYKDFWPTISLFWKRIIGITPVLFLVGKEESDIVPSYDGLMKKVKSVTNNLAFESQVVRLYAPRYFQDDICLISDIDMYPLSNFYFNYHFNQVEKDEFHILSADAYGNTEKRFPMCYNIAYGSVFDHIFNTNVPYETFIHKIKQTYTDGWFTDETMLYKVLTECNYPLVKFNRKWNFGIADRRIDRINWTYDTKLLSKGYYIDCHSLRPFNTYKEELKKIYLALA